jgi:hypothetical protein
MRRKNRKWVATAVVLYLIVMYSAYRWAIAQRIPEGNIFVRIEHQGIKRLADERAAKAKAEPQPTGESRLTVAGPAYVAARYDDTHVVFIVTTDTESRFASSPLMRSGTPRRIPAAQNPAAPLAGLQELWEPESTSLHFFPKIIQSTQPGERWILNLSPDSTIPIAIDRPIVAPLGCSLALGFLASVPPDQQKIFTASSRDYFAVRHTAVEPADPPVPSHIAELALWKSSPDGAKQIEQQLTDRMKQEVTAIDARLRANAGSPGATAGDLPIANPRPRLKEWLHADRGLLRGEGNLDYDVRALTLSPDSVPRLYIRARWFLADAPAFLMTAWFKADTQPTLLFADSSWSAAQRNGEAPATLGDSLNFQTLLNEFDADHDGWAELLMHSYEGSSSVITLYLYTDKVLVPMKTPFIRDARSPESCVDP